MGILVTILIALTGIIVFLLFIGIFVGKQYTVQREIQINAPRQKVFDYLKLLKNQDYFNKWVMVDPGMKKEFKGTDGTVGFIYAWNGNKKAGEGEQEIKAMVEGKNIETEIRFIRPFPSVGHSKLAVESVSDSQTKVHWSNVGGINYPMNIMKSMIEKMLAKDMDGSLSNLKSILEK